jgi:hypothetical protein
MVVSAMLRIAADEFRDPDGSLWWLVKPIRLEALMRKVIVMMSISLDGFVAPAKGAPDHRSMPEDPALKKIKLDWIRQAGTHAMGRVTYNEMAAHWPVSTDEYAAPMNELPKVVFSKTPERADWNDSRVARGDIAEEISALRREPGGDTSRGAAQASCRCFHGSAW